VSELGQLFVLLALIYAFECAAFVPRRALGIARRFGRWGVRPAFAASAAWRRGFVFGEPWPPLSPALVTEPLPLIVGPDGLRAGPDADVVPWEKVERVSADGTKLIVNGDTTLFATRRAAKAVAEVFDGLGGQPRAERERRLRRWLDARFDDDAIEERLPPLERETLPARIAASVLWVSVFIGLPVLLWTPLATWFLAVGAAAGVSWLAAAILFEVALRRKGSAARALRPDLSKRIAAIASPIATMRACDHLARELAGDLDPLAVAAPLVTAAELRTFGRARLIELKFRRSDDDDGAGEADRAWWQREILKRVERTLRDHDVDPETLLAEPARDGDDMIVWCPRCLAQYRAGTETPRACANAACEGFVLCPFDQPGGVTPARNSPE
jgi:hypothetical protein